MRVEWTSTSRAGWPCCVGFPRAPDGPLWVHEAVPDGPLALPEQQHSSSPQAFTYLLSIVVGLAKNFSMLLCFLGQLLLSPCCFYGVLLNLLPKIGVASPGRPVICVMSEIVSSSISFSNLPLPSLGWEQALVYLHSPKQFFLQNVGAKLHQAGEQAGLSISK